MIFYCFLLHDLWHILMYITYKLDEKEKQPDYKHVSLSPLVPSRPNVAIRHCSSFFVVDIGVGIWFSLRGRSWYTPNHWNEDDFTEVTYLNLLDHYCPLNSCVLASLQQTSLLLLILHNQHDIINVMTQYEILYGVQMALTFHVLLEHRRVDKDLAKTLSKHLCLYSRTYSCLLIGIEKNFKTWKC